MVAPLLGMALGLLGWQAGGQYLKDRRDQQLADRYAGLLGEAPTQAGIPMGPPDESGGMGGAQATPGRGLLADPTDPRRQLEFASGITKIPGQGKAGMDLLNAAFNRAQQGQQFTQSQEQQASQYGRTESRLVDQFAASHGLAKDQAAAVLANHLEEARRWQQQFDAQRSETAQRIGLDQSRLGLERQRLELERGKADAAAGATGMPKLKDGYQWADSATGIVQAPVRGTPDFAKGVDSEQALISARQNVGDYLDIFAGKQKVGPDGSKLREREGGSGTELWGETASALSAKRAKIIADVAVLRNLGVMQEGEAKRLEETLNDPTSLLGPVRGNKAAARAYEEIGDQIDAKLAGHHRANPWLVPPPPKGAVADAPGGRPPARNTTGIW